MSLPHLILGMLKKQSMSGYDLNKAFQQGVAFFWTTEQSQIYRALKKLEKEGLVQQRRVVQDDYPDKKVYSLTEAGEQVILNWLKTPLTLTDAPTREGWLGQLFYGEFIPPDELINVIDTYIADTKAFITSLQNLQEGIHAQLPPQHSRSATLRLMTLDYGLHIQQAFLDWLIHARSMIQTDDDEANE